jgi:hypothetical protein
MTVICTTKFSFSFLNFTEKQSPINRNETEYFDLIRMHRYVANHIQIMSNLLYGQTNTYETWYKTYDKHMLLICVLLLLCKLSSQIEPN